MDFSAANTTLWNIVIQLGMIAGAILLANFLRQKLAFIRNSLMPTAVIAGFILLILKHLGVLPVDNGFLEILVYHCIALGFIAMSLRVSKKTPGQKGDLTGFKSGALIVGTYLVQGVTGLVITLALAYTFMPGLFKASGLLLPMGYGQGPGQANNVGATYEALGFAGGRSFGLAIAAAGYICACIVGVILLNILAKRGDVQPKKADASERPDVSFFQDTDEIPIADSLDKLSMQLAMVLVVYLITFLVTWGLTSGIAAISEGAANTLNALLWGFNFIIGSALAIAVRALLEKARSAGLVRRQYQNNYLLNRLSGFFFDIMIVAGIASIDLQDLSGLWVPFVLLAVAGGVITWFWLKFICRRVYGDYYYEGLISMYGMLTGTIGSGILLLREIDPDFVTPAANNLVIGSSFGIILGAPVLVLVGLASRSPAMCFVTVGLAAAYWAVLTLLIFKLGKKKKS